jgi:hypothetical protein
MTATVGIVVVIYLGLQRPIKFCESIIFGHISLKIASKQLRSVTHVRCSLEICAHIQPLSIQSLPSIPSPNGGWTLWIATQLWLGEINTLSWS